MNKRYEETKHHIAMNVPHANIASNGLTRRSQVTTMFAHLAQAIIVLKHIHRACDTRSPPGGLHDNL